MEIPSDAAPRPFPLTFDTLGREVADEWYAEHARERNDDGFPHNLAGPWSKFRAYYFRFALVIHCIRLACGEDVGKDVDAESAMRAVYVVDYFKEHARRVYGRLACQPADVRADWPIGSNRARCRAT